MVQRCVSPMAERVELNQDPEKQDRVRSGYSQNGSGEFQHLDGASLPSNIVAGWMSAYMHIARFKLRRRRWRTTRPTRPVTNSISVAGSGTVLATAIVVKPIPKPPPCSGFSNTSKPKSLVSPLKRKSTVSNPVTSPVTVKKLGRSPRLGKKSSRKKKEISA